MFLFAYDKCNIFIHGDYKLSCIFLFSYIGMSNLVPLNVSIWSFSILYCRDIYCASNWPKDICHLPVFLPNLIIGLVALETTWLYLLNSWLKYNLAGEGLVISWENSIDHKVPLLQFSWGFIFTMLSDDTERTISQTIWVLDLQKIQRWCS